MNRLLRTALWLYPASHRRLYGEEMLLVARHQWNRTERAWGAGLVLLLELLWGAVGVWIDHGGKMMRGMGRGWLLDARFVLRSLWKARGYAVTSIVVLACAVAANATVFSFVRGTLLSQPPWPDPDRLMVVWGSNVQDGQLRDVVSGPAYAELQEQTSSFERLAAFHVDATYLEVDGHPEVLDAIEGTVDFLHVLGIEPFMGRLFSEEDRMSGAPESVVVTHSFWRERLDSDPEIVGTTLPFEGAAATVIGVLPEGFEFVAPAPLFLPLRDDVLAADDPGRIHYNVIGRLAPGATRADASAELARAARRFETRYPGFEGWSFLVEPLHDVTVEAVRGVIWTLAATVALVLVVALVNLATLFRIRALARGGELAVRRALGADWRDMSRILLLETGILAVVGAGLGMMAAPPTLDVVTAMVPQWIPIPESASRVPTLRAALDPLVAAVAFGSAVLGALVLTLPSLVSTLRRPRLRGGRRVHGSIRGTRLLVGLEVAVATVLCLGAALVVRSADQLLSTETGIEDEGLLTLYFGDLWGLDAQGATAYYHQVVEAVEALPGVERAGVIDYIDFQAEDDYARIYVLDRTLQPRRDMREEWRRVDEGLFQTAGMRMVSGRAFRPEDFEEAPRVAVVNEAFARKHWPAESAVGALLSTHDAAYRELQVVGVVADVRSLGPASPAPPTLYVPLQGNPRGTMGLYARVAGGTMAYAPQVREAIWAVDSSQPVTVAWPMSGFVDAWVAIPKATRALVVGLAGLALLLSAVGIFGVVSYVVRMRRSELGVRLALGATPSRLEVDQLRTMMPTVVLALGVGLAAGLSAARGARALLYGVEPVNPGAILGALALMGGAALLAAYLPARRVGRIDPTEVIRAE